MHFLGILVLECGTESYLTIFAYRVIDRKTVNIFDRLFSYALLTAIPILFNDGN